MYQNQMRPTFSFGLTGLRVHLYGLFEWERVKDRKILLGTCYPKVALKLFHVIAQERNGLRRH